MVSVLSRRVSRFIQGRLYSVAARQAVDDCCGPLLKLPPKITKLPNGVIVASIETYSPVSRVALVANAGSRYECADNLGITHCLRVAASLSTQNLTGFNITRSFEQIGADFTCSSSREYIFYKTDFRRDNLQNVMSLLQQIVTAPGFKPWELSEVQEKLKLDLASLKLQPHFWVYDLLHQAAFRDTLGHSLYAPEYNIGKYNPEQLLRYMKTYFSTGRLALVGIGVNHDELIAQAKRLTPFSSAAIAANKAKYYGGELRVNTGGNMSYVAIAVEGPSLAGKDLLHAAVLQNVMGIGPSIKYSRGSATSRLAQAVGKTTSNPFAISCLNANYTDNGLFGFFAVASAGDIEKVLQAACQQFTAITTSGTGVEEKDIARAKQQLKAQIAMYLESSDALLYDLGEQALGSDQILTAKDLEKFVDSITTTDVSNVAKKLAGGKPSMAAVGNLTRTPYLDQLFK